VYRNVKTFWVLLQQETMELANRKSET